MTTPAPNVVRLPWQSGHREKLPVPLEHLSNAVQELQDLRDCITLRRLVIRVARQRNGGWHARLFHDPPTGGDAVSSRPDRYPGGFMARHALGGAPPHRAR